MRICDFPCISIRQSHVRLWVWDGIFLVFAANHNFPYLLIFEYFVYTNCSISACLHWLGECSCWESRSPSVLPTVRREMGKGQCCSTGSWNSLNLLAEIPVRLFEIHDKSYKDSSLLYYFHCKWHLWLETLLAREFCYFSLTIGKAKKRRNAFEQQTDRYIVEDWRACLMEILQISGLSVMRQSNTRGFLLS